MLDSDEHELTLDSSIADIDTVNESAQKEEEEDGDNVQIAFEQQPFL